MLRLNKILLLMLLFISGCKKKENFNLNEEIEMSYQFVKRDSLFQVTLFNHSNKKYFLIPVLIEDIKYNTNLNSELVAGHFNVMLIRVEGESSIYYRKKLNLLMDSIITGVDYNKYFPDTRKLDSLYYFNRLISIDSKKDIKLIYKLSIDKNMQKHIKGKIYLLNFFNELKNNRIKGQENSDSFYKGMKKLQIDNYVIYDNKCKTEDTLYLENENIFIK
ncbi:hypothetical protein [Apibacter adventoris]|uniref:hypothetical protein n=1 Tax=Apibacter adventoris TaxID=1679466 RepID=UPI000CF6E6BD|nr:hypothetical protein [Apibacter adventoris]PQL93938.1 hypothetical protein C4S76_07605 [Apibacter adventoris]